MSGPYTTQLRCAGLLSPPELVSELEWAALVTVRRLLSAHRVDFADPHVAAAHVADLAKLHADRDVVRLCIAPDLLLILDEP